MRKHVFISDVHVTENCGKIKQLCDFLKQNSKNAELFILGDLFDAWLGDDTYGPWLQQLENCFNNLKASGTKIYIMHGNHDFLLGKKFSEKLKVNMISDPHLITIASRKILLTHGDTFCANDAKYQRIRPILQHRFTKFCFTQLSIKNRKKIAQSLQGHGKPKEIDYDLLNEIFGNYKADILIHGHIHKKKITTFKDMTIISLPAWDSQPEQLVVKNNNQELEYYFSN